MTRLVIIFMTCFLLTCAQAQVDSSGQPGTARLVITASTDSAYVSVDGIMAGISPLTIEVKTPGAHVVRVFQDHPSRWFAAQINDTLALSRGETREAHYSFPAVVPTGLPATLNSMEKVDGQWGSHSAMQLYVSGGTALIAGGIAAFFKIKADDRRDAFLLSGESSLRNEYRRFDTYSAVSLIVAQTGLAFFTYYLLSD